MLSMYHILSRKESSKLAFTFFTLWVWRKEKTMRMECVGSIQSNSFPCEQSLTAGRNGYPPFLGSQHMESAGLVFSREGRPQTSSRRWKHKVEASEFHLRVKFSDECGSTPNIWASRNASNRPLFTDRRQFLSSMFLAFPWTASSSISLPVEAASTSKELSRSPFNEERILEQNKRMQKLNNAPPDFPSFVREGFDVKVVANEKYLTTDTGLIYLDIVEGKGDCPKDGQQVIFHYTGYNESGRRVDSSYQQGQPAKTRIGIKGMIPGFEEGIKSMKPGGKRRIVVPPELGPPVGPSTFFSAKQFEVFDVELLDVKDCNRRTIAFYSDVVCD
ncbi:hypothetical protein O6H91_08G055300 [Diphasiastrum complanatum]|uniref:Uncharacterized protein n=1 Tax=Diphasiastrum complanatum TaxID=34168 RepID=A0ACC2CY17_DIPCM|nr:hypothetical protein O6H91_08G055300 [Diphasiastrum complanatum]